MGFPHSRGVVLFSLLLPLALCFCSSTPAPAQDLPSAQAELKLLFEDDLLYDRLTAEKAAAALPTAQYVAANASDAEGQALGRRALAEIARQLNHLADAEAQFRAVVLLYPGSGQAVWARYGLGLVCEKLAGALARPALRRTAIAEFQALLASSPAHPVANRAAEKIGLIYLDSREYEKAVEAYTKAITSYPGTPGAVFAHGGLAQAYRELRRWDDAVTHARLRASSPRYPRCAMFLVIAGMALAGKGDLAQAAAEFQKVVDGYPGETEFRAQALYQKGFCFKALGDLTGAVATWRALIANYPSHHLSLGAQEQLRLLGGS